VVPILLGQDEVEILGCGGPDSGILQNDGAIVQRQACPEGIRIGQEHEGPERQDEKLAPPPDFAANGGTGRLERGSRW
jgi:hypothetical protein